MSNNLEPSPLTFKQVIDIFVKLKPNGVLYLLRNDNSVITICSSINYIKMINFLTLQTEDAPAYFGVTPSEDNYIYAIKIFQKEESTLEPTQEKDSPRVALLKEAAKQINPDGGPRAATYGDILTNFTDIAKLWSSYLGTDLSAYQIAEMMVLFKVARSQAGFKKDNYLDIAGYAAIASELREQTKKD